MLETVRMLSSYRGTNFNAAVFVADWLESVLVAPTSRRCRAAY
ncbi:hypothetical protein [Burkholderia glumae]|nr:hypothetical protein [Burkholderia glumae]